MIPSPAHPVWHRGSGRNPGRWKKRNVGSGSQARQDLGAGAIQRDSGQIRVKRIPNIRRNTLHDFIHRTIKDEAEAIYTDELKSYVGIGDHGHPYMRTVQPLYQGVGCRGGSHQLALKACGACSSVPSSDRSTRSASSIWTDTSKNSNGVSTIGTTLKSFHDTMKRIVNTGNPHL